MAEIGKDSGIRRDKRLESVTALNVRNFIDDQDSSVTHSDFHPVFLPPDDVFAVEFWRNMNPHRVRLKPIVDDEAEHPTIARPPLIESGTDPSFDFELVPAHPTCVFAVGGNWNRELIAIVATYPPLISSTSLSIKKRNH